MTCSARAGGRRPFAFLKELELELGRGLGLERVERCQALSKPDPPGEAGLERAAAKVLVHRAAPLLARWSGVRSAIGAVQVAGEIGPQLDPRGGRYGAGCRWWSGKELIAPPGFEPGTSPL